MAYSKEEFLQLKNSIKKHRRKAKERKKKIIQREKKDHQTELFL